MNLAQTTPIITNNNNENTTPISNTTPNNGSSSKINLQQQMTNGLFIRKEIQRFESVHPNIYSVYDLVDNIPDFNLQQQIREHIVNIEGIFLIFYKLVFNFLIIILSIKIHL
jgi:Arf-GAP/GTPase/ANK repeat/PH domain-containing protein 1/3